MPRSAVGLLSLRLCSCGRAVCTTRGGLRQPQYHIAISHCYSGQVLAYQASVLCVCVRGHVGVSLIRLSMFVLLHALRSLKITLIGTPPP